MRARTVDLLTSNKEQFRVAAEVAEKRGFVLEFHAEEMHIRTEEGNLVGAWHNRHSSESGGWINYTYIEDK